MIKFYFFFLFFFVSINGLTILSPSELEGYFWSPFFRFFGKQPPFNVTGILKVAKPLYACVEKLDNFEELEGHIVYVSWGGCTPETKARAVQNSGGIAVVMNQPPLFSALGRPSSVDNKDSFGIDIVAVAIQPKTDYFENALIEGREVEINIIPEPNPWHDPRIWLTLTIIFQVYNAVCFSLTVYKLVGFIRIQKLRANVPQICLGSVCCCTIFRFFFLLEPFPWWGFFTNIQYFVMIAAAVPWNLFSIFLITLEWNKVVSKKTVLSALPSSVSRLRWVFFIWLVVLEIFMLATAFLQGLYTQNYNAVAAVGIFLLSGSMLFVALFFFYTSRKVIRFLTEALISVQTNEVFRITRIVQVIGISMLVYLVGIIFLSISAIFTTLIGSVVILVLSLSSLITINFAQALIFRIPSSSRSSKATP